MKRDLLALGVVSGWGVRSERWGDSELRHTHASPPDTITYAPRSHISYHSASYTPTHTHRELSVLLPLGLQLIDHVLSRRRPRHQKRRLLDHLA